MCTRLPAVCVLLVLAFSMPPVADVINPNYHTVQRCATVDNLDAFPDIVLVAGIYAVDRSLVRVYAVHKDSCLTAGYKFNTLGIYWTTLSYFNEVGLNGLPIPQSLGPAASKSRAGADQPSPQVVLLTSAIVPSGGQVPDSVPVVREECHYLLRQAGGALSLYLATKVSINGDDTRQTQTFDPPALGVAPKASRASAGSSAGTLVVSGGYAVLTSAIDGPATVTFFDCAGRPVTSFSRDCRTGCTYVHPLSRLASGMYWVRMPGSSGTASRQQILR